MDRFGYWNKILHVDLGDRRTWIEEPGDAFFRRYAGGRGLIGHYLLKYVPKGADALGPDLLEQIRHEARETVQRVSRVAVSVHHVRRHRMIGPKDEIAGVDVVDEAGTRTDGHGLSIRNCGRCAIREAAVRRTTRGRTDGRRFCAHMGQRCIRSLRGSLL